MNLDNRELEKKMFSAVLDDLQILLHIVHVLFLALASCFLVGDQAVLYCVPTA
jgi:hypothetical protein